jgi:hypothetical protein
MVLWVGAEKPDDNTDNEKITKRRRKENRNFM